MADEVKYHELTAEEGEPYVSLAGKINEQVFKEVLKKFSEYVEAFAKLKEENQRLRSALEKIADPTKRHKEPDKYTEVGCMMQIALEALTPEYGE